MLKAKLPPLIETRPLRNDVRIVIPAGLVRMIPVLSFVIGVLITALWNTFTGGAWFGRNIPDRATVERQIADAIGPLAKQIGETNAAISDMKKYVDARAGNEHDFTLQQITAAIKQSSDHTELVRETMRGDAKQLTERVDAVKDQVHDLSNQITDVAKRINEVALAPRQSRLR